MNKIGFVGLGNMGGPMAANLVAAGYQVHAFDLSSELLAHYADKGIVPCSSLAEVASDADAVITMLPAGKHVQSVYLGDDGLLANIKAGAIMIDCSTIDVASVRVVGEAADTAGIDFIDAPVSGGVAGAQAGTLAFMCGGQNSAYQRALPLLEVMGAKQFLAGDLGAGQIAKVCNNQLLSVLMAGTAEALAMGVKSGLDAKVLSEIMLNSSGSNWALEKYNPYPGVIDSVPSSNNYQPGFAAELMKKDLGLASEQAAVAGASTPMAEAATKLFNELVEAHPGTDFSGVQKLF